MRNYPYKYYGFVNLVEDVIFASVLMWRKVLTVQLTYSLLF